MPSCIAVSPEGTVRYWPSIAHEGTSVEDSADLQGQECDSLTDIAPLGCILATTTSTIVLVQPQITGGRHSVACRMLKTPQGWLGGIGRRMSSLIFGGLPTSQVMETVGIFLDLIVIVIDVLAVRLLLTYIVYSNVQILPCL